MQHVLSVSSMRSSEQYAMNHGTPSLVLMEKAAAGIFRSVCWQAPVAIVCGSGNNGGDGFALALHLQQAGIHCELYQLKEHTSEDSSYYRALCAEKGIAIHTYHENDVFSGFAMIVDCIFGTGFHGVPSGHELHAIRAINHSGAKVICADINSGLNSTNGLFSECVVSDVTVAIGFPKPGHYLNQAADVIGSLVIADIDVLPQQITANCFEAADAAAVFPVRKHFSNKSDFGYIGLIGGSERYSGAIRLAALSNAAMRSGAGVVKVAAGRSLSQALMPCILEGTLFPLSDDGNGNMVFMDSEWTELIRGLKAISFGMGIGNTKETEKALRFLLTHYSGKLIIDADGLNILSGMEAGLLEDALPEILLTPHLKEFSRLTGKSVQEILEDPITEAKNYAAAKRVTVLLKGPCTVITDGSVTLLVQKGCPGMATAGSGDVLSGILAAVCAYGNGTMAENASAAAWVNGAAGEIAEEKFGPVSMLAGDTVSGIAAAIKSLSDLSPDRQNV